MLQMTSCCSRSLLAKTEHDNHGCCTFMAVCRSCYS
jgi:hypothetical protein